MNDPKAISTSDSSSSDESPKLSSESEKIDIDSIHKKMKSHENNSKESKKINDQFKRAIFNFIAEAESNIGQEMNINKICKMYEFQRRRFYDVVNVFESIGCCGKINSENIKWFGLSRIPETLESIQLSLRVNNPAATLDDIFQTQKNISISNLTVSFLLCYLVMRISAVDIKHVAMFLSRSNQRYKTTLCKLYQVTHILEAAGIIQRSMMPCVMVLDPKYLVFVKMGEAQVPDPTSISYFLNDHKSNNELIYAIEKRRVEFFSGYKRIECRPYHYRTKIPHLLV